MLELWQAQMLATEQLRGVFMATIDVASASKAEFVSEGVAAGIIGSTAATLRRWRHEGRHLRYFKVGASVRYRIADLEEFLAGRVVEAGLKNEPRVFGATRKVIDRNVIQTAESSDAELTSDPEPKSEMI